METIIWRKTSSALFKPTDRPTVIGSRFLNITALINLMSSNFIAHFEESQSATLHTLLSLPWCNVTRLFTRSLSLARNVTHSFPRSLRGVRDVTRQRPFECSGKLVHPHLHRSLSAISQWIGLLSQDPTANRLPHGKRNACQEKIYNGILFAKYRAFLARCSTINNRLVL